MADDWASSAEKKFDEQVEVEKTKETRAVQSQQALDEQAPNLWGKIKRGLQGQVAAFNEREGKEVLIAPMSKPNDITIFAKLPNGQREMSVSFGSDYRVLYHAGDSKSTADRYGYYDMRVTESGNVALFSEHSVGVATQSVIEQMLNALMGWK